MSTIFSKILSFNLIQNWKFYQNYNFFFKIARYQFGPSKDECLLRHSLPERIFPSDELLSIIPTRNLTDEQKQKLQLIETRLNRLAQSGNIYPNYHYSNNRNLKKSNSTKTIDINAFYNKSYKRIQQINKTCT